MNIHQFGERHYQTRSSENTPAQVAELGKPLGVEAMLFPTDWESECEGANAGLVAMKGANSALVVDYAAADPGLIRQIEVLLQGQLLIKALPVEGSWQDR